MDAKNNYVLRFGMAALAFALAGCASAPKNPQDPFEGFNRAMFGFNDKVDQVALKPAAKVYRAALPDFVQTGIGNFFGNLNDVPTALNNFLQWRIKDGMSDVARVLLNSTFGMAGLIDVASEAWGLPKHDQDFGQTLGRWGVGSGPYLVLPLLGPTTTRDTVALPVDLKTDIWSYKDPVRWRNAGSVIRIVDKRAYILDSTSLLEEAALDRYEFVRDAYLQRRESKIYRPESPAPESDTKSDTKPGDDAAPATNNEADAKKDGAAQ